MLRQFNLLICLNLSSYFLISAHHRYSYKFYMGGLDPHVSTEKLVERNPLFSYSPGDYESILPDNGLEGDFLKQQHDHVLKVQEMNEETQKLKASLQPEYAPFYLDGMSDTDHLEDYLSSTSNGYGPEI